MLRSVPGFLCERSKRQIGLLYAMKRAFLQAQRVNLSCCICTASHRQCRVSANLICTRHQGQLSFRWIAHHWGRIGPPEDQALHLRLARGCWKLSQNLGSPSARFSPRPHASSHPALQSPANHKQNVRLRTHILWDDGVPTWSKHSFWGASSGYAKACMVWDPPSA